MRISDWSSDVCSSDLDRGGAGLVLAEPGAADRAFAIDRTRRGVDEMLDVARMARRLEHREMAFEIAVLIGEGVFEAVAHARLRREVDDAAEDRKSTRLNSSH